MRLCLVRPERTAKASGCSASRGKRKRSRSQLTLQQRGVFSWSEWAATLGEEISKAQAAGDPDTGETYYRHWLAALERLIAAKGLADPPTLARTREAWRRASVRTPHGTPIALQPADFDD